MPESREAEASFLLLLAYFFDILESGGPLPLERIDIDATKAEAKRFRSDHPARNGLPYSIDSACTARRGNQNHQGSIYPEMWRTTGKTEADTTRLTELSLTKIEYTYRGLVLDLGPLSFMIQYLTHTSAHPMPRSVYESTIKLVPKELRKFHVGMAFVFKDHVIAFHSIDLVFQPTWAKSRAELTASPTDFHSPDWAFLPAFAEWMRDRQAGDRNGLAIEAVRAASEVFLGVGVYTVLELFFLAGLSPQLTEAEVFGNPSRAARVSTAYETYLHESREQLPGLLRPAMLNGLLAPTTRQRLDYINWLYVYAKDYTKLPVRMAELVDDYVAQTGALSQLPEPWVRYETATVFDVFEPTFLSPSLTLKHNLGHLVFGPELWTAMGGELSDQSDPVTAYFKEQGLLDQPTFLRPNHYSPLFLPKSEVRALGLPHRDVYTYRHGKQIWSITPATENSQGMPDVEDSADLTRIVGTEREHMLFSYIVKKTQKVAIGPLEYCGTGHRVTVGRKTIAVPCYGDPSLSEFYAERDLKGRLLPSATPGQRRPSLGEAGITEFNKQLTAMSASRARKRALEADKENESSQPVKPKKRRMNADQRLALGLQN
ncbi:hypothetical protein R3P38DRAFT_3339037 [Favolaschia claudopus]|uniref:Uncharacterized protein n=1 Tax=Favolaschia claudopus TaxID=2862362 RepID=A0AAW0EHC9_9AGAR